MDVLKAREKPIIDLSQALARVEGIEEVDVIVTAVDAKTETMRIILRGPEVNYEAMSKVLTDNGATLRSIDEINVARKIRSISK